MSYVNPDPQPIERTIAQTVAGASASIDCQGYSWVSVQINTFYAGQSNVSFQTSNDGTNWVGQTLVAANTFQGAGSSSAGVAGVLYHGPIAGRYFRLNASGTPTSGTFGAVIEISAKPKVLQSGAFGVAPAAISDAAASSSSASMLGAAFDGGFQRLLRTPSVFKTVSTLAAGDTALWTPGTGKKFRLMRYKVMVTSGSSGGSADLDIAFRDGTTSIGLVETVFIPNLAGNAIGAYTSGWVDLGNGYLSTAANNVLNLNLSFAITAGHVRAVVAGTEE